MKDLKRIKEICRLLEEAWSFDPYQRLGQFLLNYVFGSFGKDSHIYMKEDEEITIILHNFVKKFREFNNILKPEVIKKTREMLTELSKANQKLSNKKACCVCLHDLSDHIDEKEGWRCHMLGPDGFQCECFLRKSGFDSIEGYELNKRISQVKEELELGE